MTIKEIEKQLELPRATVRFYEKEGLISPKRSGNSYREYSDEDVAVLKKIVVLRKLGMTVSDIRDYFDGAASLQELLEHNIAELEKQMKELEGALRVSKLMKDKEKASDSFDEEYYWEEIHAEEAKGNKFLDIVNDVVQYEKHVVLKEFDLVSDDGQMIYGVKESVLRALGLCLFAGIVWFFFRGMKWQGFVEGFFWPLTCIVIASAFGLPVHFLGKKYPEAANKIRKIGERICIAIGILLIILAILMWLKII